MDEATPSPEERAADLIDDLNASFSFKDSHIFRPRRKEPDGGSWVPNPEVVEVVAAAIAEAEAEAAAYERGRAAGQVEEREACAKLAKGQHNKRSGPSDASANDGYNDACDDIADAIRARGNTEASRGK